MHLIHPDLIPKELFEIPEPPKQLYIEGTLPLPGTVYLTVVGSRRHTNYGRDACRELIRGLAGYPISIISGLALGIDTIAHESALEFGLHTIAFPGSGLSPAVLYPSSNRRLAERIITTGGALISECAPETRAAEWTFPRRNRLMAGLARATLIIEAEEKSGTLITARLALDYNRELVAVPGSIFSPLSIGTNRLIREGALAINNSETLLRVLGFEPNTEPGINEEKLRDCSPEELVVLELLREPLARDDLIREIGRPTHEVNMTLSLMELKGLIREELGEIRRN